MRLSPNIAAPERSSGRVKLRARIMIGYLGRCSGRARQCLCGGGIESSAEAALAKYSPTGTVQWAYSAIGPPANPVSSIVAKCAVDSAGNSYLAGWYQGTATFGTNVLQPQGYWNFFLAKVTAPVPPTVGIVLSNGAPQLSLAGDMSSMFALQSSPMVAATNTAWQTLTTLTLTNRPQIYLDTSAPSRTNRFYRAGPPAL